jgi:hypothetical protein
MALAEDVDGKPAPLPKETAKLNERRSFGASAEKRASGCGGSILFLCGVLEPRFRYL